MKLLWSKVCCKRKHIFTRISCMQVQVEMVYPYEGYVEAMMYTV